MSIGFPDFHPPRLEFSVTSAKVAAFRRGFAEWVKDLAKDAAAEEAQRLGVSRAFLWNMGLTAFSIHRFR